ncbi:hypothetical protein [Roseovarius sp. 2305UL8-3]|uniref:hypothetical protein n=1 Tax=Roseovarius conchicola TaxID=3121636 RepID=UPI0035291734
MQFIIPILCFVVPLIAGLFAVRQGIGWAVPVLALGFATLMVWAIWKGQQAQGWDGIGYAIAAILMAAPAALGTLVGRAIGWWRKRRAKSLAVDGPRD